MYPPGQFSAWNRPSTRATWLGQPGGGAGPDDAEPGYSQLAISDPSADATSTQTWAAIEDGAAAGDWSPRRGRGDEGSQARRGDRPPLGAAAGAALLAGRAQPGASPRPAPGRAPGEQGAPGGYDAREDGGAPEEYGAPDRLPPDGGGRVGGRSRRGTGRPGGAARRQAGAAGAQAVEDSATAGGRRGPARSPAAGRPGRSQRSGRRGLRPLLLAGLAVVLVVAAGGAYYLLANGQQPTRPKAAASPRPKTVASSPSAPPGPWKFIQSRADDPQPLSLTELYPAQYSANGQSGTLVTDSQSKHCASAVLGAALETAVMRAHCTQVLRATYLSSGHQLMATIGVLNLLNVAAAEKVGTATGASEFIDPLAGKSGPARKIKNGTGIEEAEVKGHYLILIWAEFSNLHAPSGSARRLQLEQFATDLINGTANVSLTSRMVTGKPH